MAQRKTLATFLSPLAIRLPLLDPDRMLDRWSPWYRPLFGPFGLLLWLAVVGSAAVLTMQNWVQLTEDISDRILAPENLVVMLLVFPLLTAALFGLAAALSVVSKLRSARGSPLMCPYSDGARRNGRSIALA